MKRLFLILCMSLILCSSVLAMDFSGAGNTSVAPVVCGENTIQPIIIVGNESPCPGVSTVNTTDVVRPFAVPGDIFIPIPAHADATGQAMMLVVIVIPISDATERSAKICLKV